MNAPMSRQASLTGSPVTDRLVPAACALKEHVRNGNAAGVAAVFDEAAGELVDGECDPAQALAVVRAGMVDDTTPSGPGSSPPTAPPPEPAGTHQAPAHTAHTACTGEKKKRNR
jgi:hypothetical protein